MSHAYHCDNCGTPCACAGGADQRVPSSFAGLDIFVPADWDRFSILIPRTPPSMNDNEIRSHWTGFQKHKKSWQEEIEQMAMVSRIPRGYSRAIAGAIMRFPSRAARRDSGNFASVVEKALGDALANGGWLHDDDAARFLFVGVEFEDELGPPRTELVVFTHEEEE